MTGQAVNISDKDGWRPGVSPWIIAIAVMLATFMEVLDTSVANVSLPHIAGSFSATTEEAVWVLTSYLISNAIILPTTAWFSTFFGRKRLLILCIALFKAASFMCGTSTSLSMLIFARILQGIGGGALQPLSQAILLESFPPEKRGIATAVFGMGVVVAPIIGPTLGGWITDNYSWHWVFLINIPVGILAIFLSQAFVEDPPYIKNAKPGRIDFAGFGFMAIWLATLQIILDKGHRADWFASEWVRWFAVISLVSFICFVVRELTVKEPIVNLKILKNRNFAIGVFLITVVGAVLYGTLAMLPLFLQTLLGYTAEKSGLVISPRGIGSFLTIIVVGKLVGKMDNRILIILGFILLGISNIILGNINLVIDMSTIIWPNILMGVSLGLIFIPLTTMTLGTLKNEYIANGTGIFNLMRNIGGSIGISGVTTYLSTYAQVHQNHMSAYLNPYNPVYQERFNSIVNYQSQYTDIVSATKQAQGIIYGILLKQANLWGFIENFRLFGFISLLMIPLVFLFKKTNPFVSRKELH